MKCKLCFAETYLQLFQSAVHYSRIGKLAREHIFKSPPTPTIVAMPIDYKAWDHIEVSDDEDDTHPHIEKGSLFRWRHQARLERMAEAKLELQEIKMKRDDALKSLKSLEVPMSNENLTEENRANLAAERVQLEKLIQECDNRAEDTDRSWNVDTISRAGFSKTYVNKVKSPEMTEEQELKLATDLRKFGQENETKLKKFAQLKSYDDTVTFLKTNPKLFSEVAANSLAVHCVSYATKGNEELLDQTARQYLMLKSFIELAKNRCQYPAMDSTLDTLCTQAKDNFMAANNKEVFETELQDFKDTIRKSLYVGNSPSTPADEVNPCSNCETNTLGDSATVDPPQKFPLDPRQVFESLPENMKQCFITRNVTELEQVALSMDINEFENHLQRCIDSGLWVPGANTSSEANNIG